MTTRFKWKPEYGVNIQEFDKQHQQLVSLINQLYATIPAEDGRAAQQKIISDLIQYAEAHFRDEERIMREHGFPGAQRHKQAHDQLRQKMLELQEQHREGRISIPLVVSTYLQTWFTEHILATDMQYVSFLNERGVK